MSARSNCGGGRRRDGTRRVRGASARSRALLSAGLLMVGAVPSTAGSLHARDLVRLTEADGVALDLRYASARNIAGRPIAPDPGGALLQPIAARKLLDAAARLRATHPGDRLVIFDALRGSAAQAALWSLVKGTDRARFVADPAKGSIHAYGLAVDVSLRDAAGRDRDMGTDFDDFTPLAEPRLEAAFLADGRLSPAQVENRRLLRRLMVEAGFHPIAVEWWHFDALPPAVVRARFPRLP